MRFVYFSWHCSLVRFDLNVVFDPLCRGSNQTNRADLTLPTLDISRSPSMLEWRHSSTFLLVCVAFDRRSPCWKQSGHIERIPIDFGRSLGQMLWQCLDSCLLQFETLLQVAHLIVVLPHLIPTVVLGCFRSCSDQFRGDLRVALGK